VLELCNSVGWREPNKSRGFHPPAPSACLLQETHWHTTPPLVKICGIRSKEEAVACAEAGADLLGLMFVENSKRHIDLDTAREISQAIRSSRFAGSSSSSPLDTDTINARWFTPHATHLSSASSRPLLVGVKCSSRHDSLCDHPCPARHGAAPRLRTYRLGRPYSCTSHSRFPRRQWSWA
jgi:hypothetical protein